MTTKPRLFKPIPGSTYRGVVAALPDDIKAAARSLPDFKPWVVAALIAEGGEIVEADFYYPLEPGRYLVFPIPAEEET